MQVSRRLKQTLTYWAKADVDNTDLYGKPGSVAPVQLKCRWEDHIEQVRSKSGEEFTSKTRVFLTDDVDIDGYVALGVHTEADPSVIDGAYEIQNIGKIPDLRGIQSLVVIYL